MRWAVYMMAAAIAALLSIGTVAAAQEPQFYFRYKQGPLGGPGNQTPGGPEDDAPDETGDEAPGEISIRLDHPSPFGLTVGEAVSIPLAVTGDAADVTFAPAAGDAMQGLSVDPATGAVSGAPTASAGTAYSIAVVAERDGQVVARSDTVEKVLRAPLEVEYPPDDLALMEGESFPTAGVSAVATGGDQSTVEWSLENAPAWLEIVAGTNPGEAYLKVKDGLWPTAMPPTEVTVISSDAEGREDRSKTFGVSVLPSAKKLLASDGTAYDFFGVSVALNGDTALIGAYLDSDTGSAYVFVRTNDGWTQQAKLLAADRGAGDRFGYAVALDGDTAVIGANQDDDKASNSGSAYVFVRSGSTWTQQAKLTGDDGSAGDAFGYSVAISGDTVLVGAHLDDDKGADSGSAYVFVQSGADWTQQAKLLAEDGAAGDAFAHRLDIDDNVAVIGARLDDDQGSNSGSVYVFGRNGAVWGRQAKLLASDGRSGDEFGRSVAIDDFRIVVGAWLDDAPHSDSGSAYVFIGSGTLWTEDGKLLPDDGSYSDYFGTSVDVSESRVIVGAYGDDPKAGGSGSAYVFARTTVGWQQQLKITPDDGAVNDSFGISVSISGTSVLIGAWEDSDKGTSSGSAYVFPAWYSQL